jgi:hypothetical protein
MSAVNTSTNPSTKTSTATSGRDASSPRALRTSPQEAPRKLPRKTPPKPTGITSRRAAHPSSAAATTKQAKVLALLGEGTTIAAIMAATGWQAHSVRGFLAAVVKRKLGLQLISIRSEGDRIYRIASP